MVTELTIVPVGFVRSGREEAMDDHWAWVAATIELAPSVVGPDATAGLEAFSHLEVVFVFDRVDPATVTTGARHPRGNTDWPRVGIFAQRGKDRPNRLGVSRCRLVGVDGLTLAVQGLDAIDGTPVVDVKPWMDELGPAGEIRQPAWSVELMRDYWD